MFKRLLDLAFYFLKGGVVYAKRIGVNVGKNCRIYTRHFGTEPFLISIGDDVTITKDVTFITHDGSLIFFKDEKGRRYKYQPINIGNNVFIGMNAIIMPGIKIDENVIVASGSVVTKSIPTGSVVAGVPAKIIGNFHEFKAKCLKECISQADMDFNKPYKERVLQVTTNSYKEYLKANV